MKTNIKINIEEQLRYFTLCQIQLRRKAEHRKKIQSNKAYTIIASTGFIDKTIFQFTTGQKSFLDNL